jgi:hypothetical protein
MKKVKTSAVQWDGLDVLAWVEHEADLVEPKKNLLIKDYDNLTESQRDILLSMCEEAIEEYEDSIIIHINDCIAEFVSTNLDAIVKDLVKDKICSYAD